jgi:hypothetical protein
VNKGSGGDEFWGEVEIQNHNRKAETLELTARRYDGKQVMAQSYTVSPGEKRVVRIDDPNTDEISADGRPSSRLFCTLVVEPAPATVSILLRQLRLHGDQLTTTMLPGGNIDLHPNIAIRRAPEERVLTFANIGSTPGRVIFCDSFDPILGCDGPSQREEVPPFSTISGLLKEPTPTNQFLLLARSPNVMVMTYHGVSGTTSTFNTDSSITFGTVKEQQ